MGSGGLNPSNSMHLNVKKPTFTSNNNLDDRNSDDEGSLNRDDSSLEL